MDEFTVDFDQMIESKSVKNVIKLLFSSLTVVFQETELSSPKNEPYFKYNRISSIPHAAVRMLWNELLGDLSFEGDKEFRMIVSSPDDVDKAISRSCLEEFIKFMNDPKELSIKMIRRDSNNSKGVFSKLFRLSRRKKNKNMVKIPKRYTSKDPFMAFVTDILVTSELLEINTWDIERNENAIESDDEEGKEEVCSRFLKGSFTGWERGKKVSTSQYFQIFKDKYFQYGIYLSGIMNNSSILPLDAILASTSLEKRKMDTMKRWNNTMSNACRKQLVKRNILGTEDKENEDTVNYNNENNKLKGLNGMNPVKLHAANDATSYAVKMYPSHLMRASRATEVSPLLMNPRFLFTRLSALGAIETASRQKSDLDEMIFRFQLASERKLSMDTSTSKALSSHAIFLDSFLILVKCIQEHYPIKKYRKASFIQGESNIGEIGRALHLIAAYIDEAASAGPNDKNQSEYSLNAVKIYKLSLDYKIAALGNDHSSVGHTYRYLGHKYSNLRKYQEAIDAYSECTRISWAQSKIDFTHLVVTLNSLGLIYSMAGLLEESIDTYHESLAIQKVQFSKTSLQVAETLNSIGIIYNMMDNTVLALKSYTESLSIMITKLGNDHKDVADIYLNRGLAHKRERDYESAMNDLQQALRILKNKFGEGNEEVARILHHINVISVEEIKKEHSHEEKSAQVVSLGANATKEKSLLGNDSSNKENSLVRDASYNKEKSIDLDILSFKHPTRSTKRRKSMQYSSIKGGKRNRSIKAMLRSLIER